MPFTESFQSNRRRSLSPLPPRRQQQQQQQQQNGGGYGGGYGGGRYGGGGGGGPQQLPELNKVYQGTVAKVDSFGAFVQIEGFRRQGLVHISQVRWTM